MSSDRAARLLRILERVGVGVLLIAALVPRARGLSDTFDREMEGFQGSCFAAFAVNYERLGLGRFGGYPTFNVDLPSDREVLPYLYPNHPPFVPILGWTSIRLFAPAGWDEAWQQADAPVGVEGPLRLPFLLFHMASLLALWWAVRPSGAGVALTALAISAFLPISILYAQLVNYENPVYAFILLGLGFHLRWLQSPTRGRLSGSTLAFLGAGCVTFTPAFFLPGLVLQTLLRRGWRKAVLEGALLGTATLVPLLLHGAWVRHALPGVDSQGVLMRAKILMQPLFDGSIPVSTWLSLQWMRMGHFYTLGILLAACVGLALVVLRSARAWKGRDAGVDDATPASPALPLLLGGWLLLIGFYVHTADGVGLYDGQTVFLLNLAPAVCILAAHCVDAIGRRAFQLRAGFAPHVLILALLAFPALARETEVRTLWRAPGPKDDLTATEGPENPLPVTIGRELNQLLPAGAIGLYPRTLPMHTAAAYYAWRTLVPVDRVTWGAALTRIDTMLGLGDAPRYMLVPREMPAGIAEEWSQVRRDLDEQFDLIATSSNWELWPSFE